jgi:D-arabinose 1-dehydrogenase-like Zn-dependent alcohol dehydrogenase
MTTTRILYTQGNGSFTETTWLKPYMTDNEIEVKSLMTGVCRSDIDMMMGNFGPLPIEMSGHEGLGQVTKVGALVTGIKEGDYVATRGEPAYADVYNAKQNEWVKIPEPHPRYIIEPVACGINVVRQAAIDLARRQGKLLILGSGFLAWVAYNTLVLDNYNFNIDILGSNNQELWGDRLMLGTSESYDVVIDLSGKYELGTEIGLNNDAMIIDAVGKAVSYKEAQQQLWKAVTTIKPSPRNKEFIKCMHHAKWMIESGKLNVDKFWTRAYNRNTEWQQAFADGKDRPDGYSRGYIKWD